MRDLTQFICKLDGQQIQKTCQQTCQQYSLYNFIEIETKLISYQQLKILPDKQADINLLICLSLYQLALPIKLASRHTSQMAIIPNTAVEMNTFQVIYIQFILLIILSHIFYYFIGHMLVGSLARNIYYYQNINKLFPSVQEALAGITNGSKILVGGFGICGVPMNLIQGVKQMGVKDLTIVSNNCGVGDKEGKTDWGLAVLLRNKQIKRMISSYVGENAQFERQYLQGELQLEITPQGTLAQKIRSGGAGIPAFYTATGVGTQVEQGGFPIKYQSGQVNKGEQRKVQIFSQRKPEKIFNGRKFIEQQTIFGDFALVKAQKADTMGNLYFNKTARNFNADMATAAKCVIAEVQEIVEPGDIDPELVHVASVYVDRIFKSNPNCAWSQKRIQKRTVQQQTNQPVDSAQQKRLKIIARAARQVKNGMNINLGIGIPTLLPSVLPQGIQISLQSQNGIFGVGPYPTAENVDPDLINAGKETVTLLPGGSLFSSSQSFAIIRGGHLDLTMLGALQVSEACDIANWIIPGKLVKGMGGAMDLVACGSRVIVVMEHSAKNKKTGQVTKKLFSQCRLPLTARGVVSMVITELAVFQNRNGRLVLTEIAQGTTIQQVQSLTDFKLQVASNLGRF